MVAYEKVGRRRIPVFFVKFGFHCYGYSCHKKYFFFASHL